MIKEITMNHLTLIKRTVVSKDKRTALAKALVKYQLAGKIQEVV